VLELPKHFCASDGSSRLGTSKQSFKNFRFKGNQSMISQFRFYSFASLLLLVAGGWLWSESTLLQAAPSSNKNSAEPVEPDMHEFMEYVFQPTFKRLKPVMAAAPSDNQAWKAIKADSLILAEGGNLLLIRQPKDDAPDWVKHSVLVLTSAVNCIELPRPRTTRWLASNMRQWFRTAMRVTSSLPVVSIS
jgi:hypothetical protein